MHRFRTLGLGMLFAFKAITASAFEICIPDEPGYAEKSEFLDPLRVLDTIPEYKNLDVVVSVGREGLLKALRTPGNKPILATYLFSSEFHSILKSARSERPISAVFADPDPILQLYLASEIFGKGATFAMLTRDMTAPAVTRAKGTDFKVNVLEAARQDLFETLAKKAMPGTDALIMVPDDELFNGSTAYPIIETLLDDHKGVIGYNPVLVDAGAIATVYSSPLDLSKDISDTLNLFRELKKLPAPHFPTHFHVKVNARYKLRVNPQMSRWLRLSVPDEAALEEKLNAISKGAK